MLACEKNPWFPAWLVILHTLKLFSLDSFFCGHFFAYPMFCVNQRHVCLYNRWTRVFLEIREKCMPTAVDVKLSVCLNLRIMVLAMSLSHCRVIRNNRPKKDPLFLIFEWSFLYEIQINWIISLSWMLFERNFIV